MLVCLDDNCMNDDWMLITNGLMIINHSLINHISLPLNQTISRKELSPSDGDLCVNLLNYHTSDLLNQYESDSLNQV